MRDMAGKKFIAWILVVGAMLFAGVEAMGGRAQSRTGKSEWEKTLAAQVAGAAWFRTNQSAYYKVKP